MFNVKSKADYDALEWENRLHYNKQNPGNQYGKDELQRTKQVLYKNPTEQAQDWYSKQMYVAGGGTVEDAILGNYDKSAYSFQQQPWVRDMMKSYGISDDRIGYSGGKVTLDGKDFMTPDVVADGKSYASKEALQDAFRSYNDTNDVVAVRSYINSKNPNVTVGWDENLGQVKVGSVLLTPDYIQDGVAYVTRSKVDEALAREVDNSGLYTRWDILNQNNDRWSKRLERLYDKVENPDPFTYSAEEDPLYQEFKREWLKQSQNQYDDTIAKMNSQSGGAPSLGAMTAAWNLLQDSNSQLDAYKQQFRQQAYQEYVDEYNRDVARLETALGIRDDEFNREYGVNSDTINDMYNKAAWDEALLDSELNRKINNQAYDQAAALFPVQLDTAIVNLEQAKVDLEQNKQLAPYQIKQMVQAVALGDLKLTAQQHENLIRQYETMQAGISLDGNFNSSRSNGDGSGGADVVSDGYVKEGYEEQTQPEETAQTPEETSKEPTVADNALIEAKRLMGGEPGKVVPTYANLEIVFRYALSHKGLSNEEKAKLLYTIKNSYNISEEGFKTIADKIDYKG